MKRTILLLLFLAASSVMALTPHERQLVTKARNELKMHDVARDQAIVESDAAKASAAAADFSASVSEKKAADAQKQADEEHKQLGIAISYKPKADKLDSLSKYWGIPMILAGFGILVKHILILIAVLVVLAILIGIASLFLKATFPWLTPIATLLEGLWSKLLSIFTPKKKS